jgi:tRNA pseudouridine38-40 synthase
MARYQIILAYDGTDYWGFQRQKETRTVQAVLESALHKLGWQERSIIAAGRTDAGVHASGQVVVFDLDWQHTPAALGDALNANLPHDVAVRSVNVVQSDFHPRYDAVSRTYRYRLFCSDIRNPLKERYAWRVWPAVNQTQVDEAAQMLVGPHDFSMFGTSPRKGGTTIRQVFQSFWTKNPEEMMFEISANGFLYHMVRRLVFEQVLVGQRKLTLEEFRAGVEASKPLNPGIAPPQGLELVEVVFGS